MTHDNPPTLTKYSLPQVTTRGFQRSLVRSGWVVKNRPGESFQPTRVVWNRSTPNGSATAIDASAGTVRSGNESISYLRGPMYSGGHVSWKPCFHERTHRYSGLVGYVNVDCDYSGPNYKYVAQGRVGANLDGMLPSMPSEEWPAQDLWNQVWDQIDLNSKDAVLAYSSILQSVPLLGSLAKANSILRRVSSWAKTSLKKKPFSEVIRTAIQADFIERFVISPTLDDLRKVQQSMNYVIDVVQKAHHRNSVITPLRSRYVETLSSSSRTSGVRISDAWNGSIVKCDISYRLEAKSTRTSGLYLLAELQYDTGAIDPLRVWLNRVGLSRPLESAWDMIPFSFVVDYFTRCGDFISHISSQMASDDGLRGRVLRLHDVWATSRTSAKVQAKGLSARWSGWSDVQYRTRSFTPGVETLETSIFSRTQLPLEALDQSGFWNGKGLISPRLSVIRARTIAELFVQARL